MLSRALIAASALLFAPAAYAADLIVDAPYVPGVVEASNPSIYVQLLGGAALGTGTTYVDGLGIDPEDYELLNGYAFAAAVGVVVIDGLSIEADVFHAYRDYDPDVNALGDGYSWYSTSLMANVKYSVEVSDMFSVYGAAGLGMIYGTDVYPTDSFDHSGPGYQLIVGASAEVADNIAVVGEIRYQDSFSPLEYDLNPDATEDISTTSALVGLKIGF